MTINASTVESRYLEPSRDQANSSRKRDIRDNGTNLVRPDGKGTDDFVRDSAMFEIAHVRDSGTLLYCVSKISGYTCILTKLSSIAFKICISDWR